MFFPIVHQRSRYYIDLNTVPLSIPIRLLLIPGATERLVKILRNPDRIVRTGYIHSSQYYTKILKSVF